MDTNLVIVIVVLAVVGAAAFAMYRYRAGNTTDLSLPFGIKLRSKSANDPPTVTQRRGRSRSGGAEARSEIGGGVLQEDLEVEGDLRAVSTRSESPHHPKDPTT